MRAVGFRDPTKRLSVVTSIGSDAWDRLFSGPRPAELHPFVELHGGRHHAPSTPGDLLFHIRAESMDVCFELAGRIVEAMGGAVTVVDEVHGFQFFDNRDLLGFVDGTENPDGPIAVSATEIGDEDPDFAGGCYVHVQKYLHDMDAWNSLSTEEQERVIGPHQARGHRDGRRGRSRPTPTSRSTSSTDADGNELKIVRHNMPFGEIGKAEFGTYFIGYSRSAAVTERMLRQHVHRRPAGQHRPHPGLLDRGDRRHVLHPDRRTSSMIHRRLRIQHRRKTQPAVVPVGSHDGSLGIGSLKGTLR